MAWSVVAFGVLLLVAHPALADLVKLRDGSEILGTANPRQQIETNPFALEWIDVLLHQPDSTGRTQVRIAAADIVSITLLDDAGPRVIDFERQRVDLPPHASNHNSALAAGTLVVGAAAIVVGSMVKFGKRDRFFFIGDDFVGTDDRKRNVWNHVTVGAGVALMVVGFLIYEGGRPPSRAVVVGPTSIAFRF